MSEEQIEKLLDSRFDDHKSEALLASAIAAVALGIVSGATGCIVTLMAVGML